MWRSGFVALAAGLFMFNAGSAFADECDYLDEDNTWNDSMIRLVGLMTAQEYEKAENLSHDMSLRCSRSPMLNYIEAKIQEEKNDIDAAKLYYQKASEYTYDFAVAPDTAKKIWYARYEAENPERTQGGVDRLRADRDKTFDRIKQAENRYATILASEKKDRIDEYKTLTWTGTGLGIAGIVMLGIGVGIAATLENDDKYYSLEQKPDSYAVKPGYSMTWALIGAGGALTVAGTVMAGVYGYRWTHFEQHNELAFQVSPNHLSFSMAF